MPKEIIRDLMAGPGLYYILVYRNMGHWELESPQGESERLYLPICEVADATF